MCSMGNDTISMENGPLIVDWYYEIHKFVIFHRYVLNYQRVTNVKHRKSHGGSARYDELGHEFSHKASQTHRIQITLWYT